MAYVALSRALYDYTATADDELSFAEDALLYVLDASDPEWHKAKLKPPPGADAHDDADAARIGLVPANYLEPAEPRRQSRALYDYAAQTDEELDLAEDALLNVFDDDDDDWLLVSYADGSHEARLGFVPKNYVDEVSAATWSCSVRRRNATPRGRVPVLTCVGCQVAAVDGETGLGAEVAEDAPEPDNEAPLSPPPAPMSPPAPLSPAPPRAAPGAITAFAPAQAGDKADEIKMWGVSVSQRGAPLRAGRPHANCTGSRWQEEEAQGHAGRRQRLALLCLRVGQAASAEDQRAAHRRDGGGEQGQAGQSRARRRGRPRG
jgi:hypothetical protein